MPWEARSVCGKGLEEGGVDGEHLVLHRRQEVVGGRVGLVLGVSSGEKLLE